MSRIMALLRDESGNDLIEYALLASFISIVSMVTVRAIGPLVNNLFEVVRSTIAG